jgi:phage shock protein PspC (stress-responsive transcriptional regulator)
MNKTIIININGVVFHIEEDAYEILRNYMTEVKRHFYNSADSLEITTDIENRIAEMFTQLLTAGNRQVITDADVNQVIAQMGSVNDFEFSDEPAAEQPAYSAAASGKRKLFRDADDHIMGGVCAGLASYFDIETVWVRLAFVLTIFAGGAGLLAYIVLWVVVPKALTRADRMSMRGQPLDLQGFKRNFEEEMGTVKGHLATLQDEARPLYHKTRSFAGAAAQHTGDFLGGAGRMIAKVIAVCIAVACCFGIASVLIGIIAFVGYGVTSFGPGGFENVFPVSVIDYQHNVLFFAAAFLAIAIPLFAIMFIALSAAFNRARFTRQVGSTLLIFWLAAVGVVTYYGARIASEFKQSASFTQTVNVKPDSTNTYYLKLNEIKYLSAQDSARLNIRERFNGKVIINEDNDENHNGFGHDIDIYIERSDVLQPVLEETFSARGNTYADALMNARNTTYLFSQQNQTLQFGNRLQVAENSMWRNQAISMRLRVPLNSKVVVDRSLAPYIRNLDYYECQDLDKNESSRSAAFKMTNEGLKCLADTLKADTADTENQ